VQYTVHRIGTNTTESIATDNSSNESARRKDRRILYSTDTVRQDTELTHRSEICDGIMMSVWCDTGDAADGGAGITCGHRYQEHEEGARGPGNKNPGCSGS